MNLAKRLPRTPEQTRITPRPLQMNEQNSHHAGAGLPAVGATRGVGAAGTSKHQRGQNSAKDETQLPPLKW